MAGQIPTKRQIQEAAKAAPTKTTPAKAPGKAVATIKKDTLPTDLTTVEAARLTKKIKTGVENVVELLHEAWQGRVWIVLGHKNWDTYIDAEFGGAPLALPRDKRKPTVASLAERGWSSRAISAVTGVSQRTAANDAAASRSPEQNCSTDQGDSEPTLDGEPVVDAEFVDKTPPTRTGLDGKPYKAERRKPTAKPMDLVAAAQKIGEKVDKLIGEIDDLYDNHGAGANVQVENILATKVSYFIDMAEKRNLMPQIPDTLVAVSPTH